MKGLHMVAFILLVVGGLNWGLVGINPDWNVVELLGATLAKVVYILVGLAAISEVVTHKTNCKNCSAGSTGM